MTDMFAMVEQMRAKTLPCADEAVEVFEERAAIAEYDGLLTREEAEKQALLESEQYRHACEVRDAVKRFFPRTDRIAEHLKLIAVKRGQEAADRLRQDVWTMWQKRSIELAEQA